MVSRRGRRSRATQCGLSPGTIAPTSEPGVVEPAGEDELSPRVVVTMVAMRSHIKLTHTSVPDVLESPSCTAYHAVRSATLSLHQIQIQTFLETKLINELF